jgi:hypothetical protein
MQVALLSLQGFGCPVLVIPWQVLQELDIMKDKRGNVKNSSLATRASRAVSFLHSNFASKHPRLRGKSSVLRPNLFPFFSYFLYLFEILENDNV